MQNFWLTKSILITRSKSLTTYYKLLLSPIQNHRPRMAWGIARGEYWISKIIGLDFGFIWCF